MPPQHSTRILHCVAEDLLKVTDDITISATSFCNKHPKSKNRKYLEDILKNVLDTVLPSGPFAEHDEEYVREPHIPDMYFESEAYYVWEEEMADDIFRRSWEEREEEARQKGASEGERDEEEIEDYYGGGN